LEVKVTWVAVDALVKMRGRLGASPLALAVIAALTISFSAILVKASGATPSTAAIFRCLYALPILAALAWRERAGRAHSDRSGAGERRPVLAAAAGVFLALDLICWHHSIEDLGAGLATVLGNLQIAFLPLIAWVVLSERPGRRMLVTLPLALTGVVLISGVFEHGAYGSDPSAGGLFGLLTGVTYSICLLLLRAGSRGPRNTAEPLFLATLTACASAIVVGLALGEARLVPSWPSAGWLVTLALGSQVLGWLLITHALPRLPAAVTSIVLTIQPVGSMCLAVLIFGERPTALQLVGLLLILSGLLSMALPAGGREVEQARGERGQGTGGHHGSAVRGGALAPTHSSGTSTGSPAGT
jgi:drug/metabolite transporter (DMT)-like permease